MNTATHATHATRLRSHSAIATGTTHTQWCDHEMGETISIANAPRHVPSTRSSARHRWAASSSTATASGTATASHRRVGGSPSSSLLSAPYVDWLWANAGGPTRVASNSPWLQYVAAAPGIAAKPTTTVPANAMSARPAAVRRPTRTRSTTNSSGVSFTPAAMPTRTPDQRRSGPSRSTSTTSISSTLTCPKARFCHTGSSATAAAVTSATSHPGAGRPSARRTTMTTAASAPTDAPVHNAAASHPGISARAPSRPPRTAGT